MNELSDKIAIQAFATYKQGKTKRAIPKDTPVKTHSHTILSIGPDDRLRLFQIDDSNVIVF